MPMFYKYPIDVFIEKVFFHARQKNINEIISCTTRPPRQHEINGVNYNFLSDEEFINKIYDDEMIETSNFNGWLYGTAYDTLKLDKINIGVFNPEGIYSLLRKKEEIDLKVFYINASDKTRMLR